MSTTIGPPRPFYENTLIDRCRRAYDDASTLGLASQSGIAQVFEQLAAEIMAQQHMRGAMDAHEVARMLIEGARPRPVGSGQLTAVERPIPVVISGETDG